MYINLKVYVFNFEKLPLPTLPHLTRGFFLHTSVNSQANLPYNDLKTNVTSCLKVIPNLLIRILHKVHCV